MPNVHGRLYETRFAAYRLGELKNPLRFDHVANVYEY